MGPSSAEGRDGGTGGMWRVGGLKRGGRTDLSHAVDVYSDWIDACDEIANPKPAKNAPQRRDPGRGSQSQSQARQTSDPHDEADKGGGGGGAVDDVGDVSDLEDFEDEDDDDMKLPRGGATGGNKRQAVISDDDEDDY